jgi:hypothetical protein
MLLNPAPVKITIAFVSYCDEETLAEVDRGKDKQRGRDRVAEAIGIKSFIECKYIKVAHIAIIRSSCKDEEIVCGPGAL